ncbi:MAG: hypothetical protein J5892_03780 [Bacilli bacterium]|nr:hypothetical protein [Bacilli bacterium]
MNIITLIKKLFKKHVDEPSDFVTRVLPSLKFGDVIIAERFNNDIEKEEMGANHDIGPYIVVGFDNDKIIGCYCTSKNTSHWGMQIGKDYNIFKNDTWVDTRTKIKTIDEEAFINKGYYSLNEEDKLKLNKRLTRCCPCEYNDFGLKKRLWISEKPAFLGVRDVFKKDKNMYLIIQETTKYFKALKIEGYDYHTSSVNFNTFKIMATEYKHKQGVTYLNTIPEAQYKTIISNYEAIQAVNAYRSKIFNDNKAVRGSVFEFMGHLYYTYGITGDTANCFKVDHAIGGDEDYQKIDGKRFLLFFNDTLDLDLNNSTYKLKYLASEDEMDNIKEFKKDYYKKRVSHLSKGKNQNNNCIYKKARLQVGDMVYQRDITKQYIILQIEGDIASIILFNDLKKDKMKIMECELKSLKRFKNVTAMELTAIDRKLNQIHAINARTYQKHV